MGRPHTKRSLALTTFLQTRVTDDAAKQFTALASSKRLSAAAYLRIIIMNELDAAAASTKKGA